MNKITFMYHFRVIKLEILHRVCFFPLQTEISEELCKTGQAPARLNERVNGPSGIKHTPITWAAVNRCVTHQRHALERPDNIQRAAREGGGEDQGI